ncbi:unnamed protein product [Choristocarpus tenellus]
MICGMSLALSAAVLMAPLETSAFAIQPARFSRGNPIGRAITPNVVRTSTALRMTAEEEVEEEVEEGVEGVGEEPEVGKKTKAPTWMFNDKGVAYAPWMVDAFDPENLAKVQASIEARKAAEAAAVPEAQGALAKDPQKMELSGLGLQTKKLGDAVELIWRTGDETGNLGFIVSRRAAKTDEWVEIASFRDWPPLNSKGSKGGVYSFVDENSGEEGRWVYRISDMSESGVKNDLCQALVELESSSTAMQTKLIVAGVGVAFAAVVAAGVFLDPMQ